MHLFLSVNRIAGRHGSFLNSFYPPILALPNHFVVQRIGDRAVVMIGGISACISFLVAAIAPNVTVWSIAVGGGVGK